MKLVLPDEAFVVATACEAKKIDLNLTKKRNFPFTNLTSRDDSRGIRMLNCSP